jgi:predicted flap endonuclease-1-like 5' DNA nuclease
MTDSDLPKGIGAPATRALTAAGYRTLDQLAGVPVDDLLALHGVGPKAIRILTEVLGERGQALG